MKHFIIKVFRFVLPFFIFFECFLPINLFTHRPWEAFLFNTKNEVAFPFYPNQNIDMLSVGDLCHHTEYEVIKRENWITDKLGYRNDTFVKKADILLIGDSFIVGSSLPQDSTLTNLLKSKLNTEVYNLAPANFDEFIYLLNNDVIEKPKLVVFSIVERNLPAPIKVSTINFNMVNNKAFVFKDRVSRLYSIKYLKSRMLGSQGGGIRATLNSKMFFLYGEKQEYYYEELNQTVETIIQYKNYCDSIGVDFLFLPLPNKETIYYEYVPFEVQPDYLFKLDSLLICNNIKTINTLLLFNNSLENNSNKRLFHLDDSHWNSDGVNLLANEFVKKARAH